jgi:hypothetical protein
LNKSIFLPTNINKENMYWDWNDGRDHFVNKFRQETLLLEFVMIPVMLYDITEWTVE